MLQTVPSLCVTRCLLQPGGFHPVNGSLIIIHGISRLELRLAVHMISLAALLEARQLLSRTSGQNMGADLTYEVLQGMLPCYSFEETKNWQVP